MVGSEVDHKYLGAHAKATLRPNPALSNGLYKLLGLSTLLSRKLLRARKQRKLDPTRTTKSLDLYRHIIWMSREGLGILTAEVLPHLRDGVSTAVDKELQVLALKMHASFLHIFVLFDHTYTTPAASPANSGSAGSSPGIGGNGVPVVGQPTTRSLETYAYMAPTIQAFARADAAATRLLPSSHPLRLSTKLEYSAFTYDCTRDFEGSRRIAKGAVDEAFRSIDPMDDESFEDAMESKFFSDESFTESKWWLESGHRNSLLGNGTLIDRLKVVGALGAMAKRGLKENGNGHPARPAPPPVHMPAPAAATTLAPSSSATNGLNRSNTTAKGKAPMPVNGHTNGHSRGGSNGGSRGSSRGGSSGGSGGANGHSRGGSNGGSGGGGGGGLHPGARSNGVRV